MIQPVGKKVWRFIKKKKKKKLRIKPSYDPAISLLGIYQRKAKTYTEETKIERDTCISLFIAAQFTVARI